MKIEYFERLENFIILIAMLGDELAVELQIENHILLLQRSDCVMVELLQDFMNRVILIDGHVLIEINPWIVMLRRCQDVNERNLHEIE